MTEIDPSVGATDWQFMTPQLPVRDVREAQVLDRQVLENRACALPLLRTWVACPLRRGDGRRYE